MENLGSAILDSWLPSRWPRLVAGAALALIGGTLSLSLWASKIGLTLTEPQISAISTVGTPWLLLVAFALIHYLVLREKNASLALQPWKFRGKKVLTIGEKYDVFDNDGNKFTRITLKEISKQLMPEPYIKLGDSPQKYVETETATFSFDPMGFVYPGQGVKSLPINEPYSESIFVLGKNMYSEEVHSVFFFSTQGHELFFRCFVDHINSAKQEVELDVYFLKIAKL